jgi:hypothetical protein
MKGILEALALDLKLRGAIDVERLSSTRALRQAKKGA